MVNAVTKLEDAGTYTVYLVAKGLEAGTTSGNSAGMVTAAVYNRQVQSKGTDGQGVRCDKVYDGTTDITEEQGVLVKLCNDIYCTPDLQDIRADQVEWAYQRVQMLESTI